MAQLPIRNLRLRAFTDQELDRASGSSGEVYYDRTAGTLRLYSGSITGGTNLAREDLANVAAATLRDRVQAAGLARVEYTVTIQAPQAPDVGNKYVLNGVYRPQLNFVVGYIYVFNQNDPTNVYFPNATGTTINPHNLNFSADNLSGEQGGGTSYLADVVYLLNGEVVTQAVYNGPAYVSATSRQVRITVTNATPSTLYYWCWNHVIMGNSIAVDDPGSGGGGSGDVQGPGSSTDNALARFNLATGKIIQNSLVTISDLGAITAPLASSVIPFHYDSQADFPSATTYHGAIAHSHADGRMYFAHSGAWAALANASELVSLGNLSFGTGSITTTDSSAITVVPQTQFRSNILVDGDVGLTGNGSKRVGEDTGGWIEFNQDITIDPATNHDFVIDTYNGATHYRWAFDSGGDIIFPDGSVQATAFTGNVGSINLLADVDTVSTPPTVGQVLKWNGTNWVPAADATVGGAGTDADTLDGLDSSYFLNFANISNKPNIFNTVAVAGQTSVVADSVTDTLTLVAGTGLTITTNAGTDTITITNTVTDTNTTYAVSAETSTGGVNLRLTGSDAVTDDVKFAEGTNITLTRTDANTITIASSYTDTNTTYSISAETNASGADIRLTGSDAATDNLTIAAGANVTVTRTNANTITIASTASGGGGGTVTDVSVVNSNGFSGTVASSTTTPAITISTTLSGLLKGNGTSLLTATAGTDFQAALTLTTTGSSGAATFDGSTLNIPQYGGTASFTTLTDVPAGLTIDKVYLPAITMLTVGVNGNVAYTFDQYSGNNPVIYAISGTTIAFNLAWTVGLHPFLIRSGGANYTTGLVHVTTGGVVTTGASALGKNSGTLYWKIPAGASGTFQYVCSSHVALGMLGDIIVKDIAAI